MKRYATTKARTDSTSFDEIGWDEILVVVLVAHAYLALLRMTAYK